MKITLTTFCITLVFPLLFSTLKNGAFAPFGTRDKIIKIRELPDKDLYQLDDGTYYDIGSLYTVKRFLWLSYSFGESKYVGYLNSQEKYVPLTPTQLKTITQVLRIKLPKQASISFFDLYISKILLLLILGILGYYSYKIFKQRKRILQAQNQEELPPWPPN